MTPGARIAAAIGVLDRVIAGEPAEKALVNWARGSRFAGSGDRAAVRDHAFDALRQMNTAAAMGGGMTGRGLMLGVLRGRGEDIDALFTGEGHSPAKVGPEDAPRTATEIEALDCPEWLIPQMKSSLGDDFEAVMNLLQTRAPVFLRANVARLTLAQVIATLESENIVAVPHPLSSAALEVTEGWRRIANSDTFAEGLVELQDAASQAVVDMLPLSPGMKVLDYCAGGGGKTLAMAARSKKLDILAHDIDPRRMGDLPVRAKRAGAKVRTVRTQDLKGGNDLVLVDAPCSGSGAWRRSPEAKWRLEPARLAHLVGLQDKILDETAALVRPGGWLAYATCSLLDVENGERIAAFLQRHPGFTVEKTLRLTPIDGGDGFYAVLMKAPA